MSYSTAPGSAVGDIPSQEAVGELKVVTNPFSAEYGRTNGGTMLFATKSGTDRYHGQLFEYNRSFGLSSTIFDTNRAHQGKAPLPFNTPGGRSGGPIYKKKLFGFFSHEYMDEHAPTLEYGTVPTQAERKAIFPGTHTTAALHPRQWRRPLRCTILSPALPPHRLHLSDGDTNNNLVAAGLMDPSGIATNLFKYIPLPDATGNPGSGA